MHDPHDKPTPKPEININPPSGSKESLSASFNAIGMLEDTVLPIFLELLKNLFSGMFSFSFKVSRTILLA
jgi:hypothetical protein